MATGAIGVLRPRLRRDAYVIPTAEGARVLTNDDSHDLAGVSIHQWLSRLAPYLTGHATLDELTAKLRPDTAEMVRRIVTVLHERGVVRHGPAEPEPVLTYLDSFLDDAEAGWQRCQSLEVSLAGDGALAVEVAQMLQEAGFTVRELPFAGEVDLMAQVGAASVQCVDNGDEVWIVAGQDTESAWRRLADWGEFADPVESGLGLDPAGVAVAAGIVATSVMRLAAGLDESHLIRVHLPTLTTSVHRWLRHPGVTVEPAAPAQWLPQPAIGLGDAPGAMMWLPRQDGWGDGRGQAETAKSFMDKMTRLQDGPRLDREALDRAGAVLLDPRAGVLGEVSERDWVQLPLNVVAVTVANPPRVLHGAGLSALEARWAAVRRGVTAYAGTMVDPGRMIGDAVWGQRLGDGNPLLVPAERVFGFYDLGSASGLSWAEAVQTGLLDLCAHYTAESAARSGRGVRLDPDELVWSPQALVCLKMLAILEVTPVIFDVTGPLRAPTLAFGVERRTIAYVSGLQVEDTLAAGLQAILLDDQSWRSGQGAYAPALVPQLRVADALRVAEAPGSPSPSCTTADVVDAMTAAGLDPVVVPLDHDAQVHRIVPYLARVVTVP